MTRRCLNLLRDERNRARLRDRHDAALRGPVRTTCEERVIDLDLLLQLAKELDTLSAEVLVYRFVDDLTQEEIAELTGKSRKTVGKLLDAARAAVRRLSDLRAPGGAR